MRADANNVMLLTLMDDLSSIEAFIFFITPILHKYIKIVKIFVFYKNNAYICFMENKNVTLAKRELIQFLKQHKAVAVYFWTIYGHKVNTNVLIDTLNKIEYETRPKQLCELYEDLIGKLRNNPNIKDKAYWSNDTLFKVYKKWCEYTRNKFHII